MSAIHLIATLGIVATFGAFMLALAFAERRTNTTWPEMKQQPAKVAIGPHGTVRAA